MGLDVSKQGGGGVSVGFVLLACGTAFNILVHKLCESQPSKLRGDKLTSLEITWVTSSLMIMTMSENGAAEGILQGYVDTAFVGQDVIIKFPVGKTGPESGGNVLQGCL